MQRQSLLLKHLLPSVLAESDDALPDIAKLAETLKLRCPVSVAQYQEIRGNRLFRGVKSDAPYIRHDPTLKIRKSLGSTNLSLFYMANSDKWLADGIPPRNRSVIFTNSSNDAISYGDNVYFVFLEGDPVVGFGKHGDNYDNFRLGGEAVGIGFGYNVNEIDSTMKVLYDAFIYDNKNHSKSNSIFFSTDWKKIRTGLMALDRAIKKNPGKLKDVSIPDHVRQRYDVVISKILAQGGVMEFLDQLYDPLTNNIEAVKLSKLPKAPKATEYWSTGVAHLIKTEYEGELSRAISEPSI